MSGVEGAARLGRARSVGIDVCSPEEVRHALAEGDVVAILSAGGCCRAVAAPRCLRPAPRAVFFSDRLPG